jgi:excisionase family DNA binding protein
MTAQRSKAAELLTVSEVARMFRVDSNTVRRWIAEGLLKAFRTPGGHYRIPADEVRGLLIVQHKPPAS